MSKADFTIDDVKRQMLRLIEAIEAYVPYVNATLRNGANVTTSDPEWRAVHAGRAESSYNQLSALLERARETKAAVQRVSAGPTLCLDRSTSTHRGTGILMIHLKPGVVDKTLEVVPNWVVDFDKNKNPIAFEVLAPTRHFPQAILDLLPPEFPETEL